MHILQIKIDNFYSYDHAEFKFNDYNLIVGPNNSGKTNLMRLLSLLKESSSIDIAAFPKKLRYHSDEPSFIHMKLSLTDMETKLLLELIFRDELTLKEFPAYLKELDIVIAWTNTISDNPIPQYIAARFGNGLILFKISNNDMITYSKNVEDIVDSQKFLNIRTDASEQRSQESTSFQAEHAFIPQNLIINENFRNDFFNGESIEKYFIANHKICTWIHTTTCNYNETTPRKYISDSIEFLGGKKAYGAGSNFWIILTKILQRDIVFVKEILPSYQDLIAKMLRLKLENEAAYYKLQKDFESLFNGISFAVKQQNLGPSTNNEIITLENDKEYSLEESASGHLAAINILYNILNRKDSIIFLDEPEVHFHPTKITAVSEKLLNLSKESRNQIIVITHSPHFLDSLLANYKKYNVIHLKKENFSIVRAASDNFVPGIKSHIFNPEVFFANCVIIVEGPSDEFTLKSISDGFGGILHKNNVVIANAHNWNRVDPYIDILSEYGIPYVAMVDKEYNGNKSNVVRFTQDLEQEVRDLGWNRQPNEKLNPEKAYSLIMELISSEEGKNKLKQSNLWTVIKMALQNAGVEEFN